MIKINIRKYSRFLPKLLVKYILIVYSSFIDIMSAIVWKIESFSRPVTYRILILIMHYKIRHYPIYLRKYMINRWWNIKYYQSKRWSKELYQENMQLIAKISEDTKIPQYVLLEKYPDLSKIKIKRQCYLV